MTGRTWWGMALLIILSSGIWLSGCAGTSPPARFYTLSAMGVADTGGTGAAAPDAGIGVGPLSLPDYLDRQQIVVRSGRNEIQIAEYHLWAGSLQDEMLRVLAANLALLLASERVYAFPWSRSHLVAYTVPVRISEFDGSLNGKVLLRAQWTVIDSSRRALATRESNIEETVEGFEYAALAAAHSRALEGLAREIAAAVKSLKEERTR